MTKRPKKQKVPLTPKVTFVGGKWYNELGKEVPKPQRQTAVQGQRLSAHDGWPQAQQPSQRYEAVLERLANCTCERPQDTGHLPGCIHFASALYVCERASREHIAMLAKLGGTTISDLERARHDFVSLDADRNNGPLSSCPDVITVNDGRRRCWKCPYWTRHPDETPFDHQKGA